VKKLVLLILPIILLGGCIKKIERPTRIDPSRYFPLNKGDEYLYSGPIRKVVTSNDIDLLFTRAFLDSTGNLVKREDVVIADDGVRLKSIFTLSDKIPTINFEPPLPYSPWTNLVGDTLLFNTVEIRSDSINSHLRVIVKFEVLSTDTLKMASGEFGNCIKLKMIYRTIDETESKFLDGVSYFWYVRDIGIVKYATPTISGELLQATVGGENYP